MTTTTADAPAAGSGSSKLAILLAMAMFVLVVDTSLMNVSISAVVKDLDTTASGVQSAIALEALVSAAFILLSSKIGDLIGRKKAYILGLIGYAIGALSMVFAQNLTTIIICWAITGGIGASLLLPAMQSLIHGNFEGAAQRRAYALVGASAAIAAAVGPLLGGFITTYLSWRVGFGLEVVIIAIVLIGVRLVKDVPYTGDRKIDVVGAILSVIGMGGVVLGILIWQEGGDWVVATICVGLAALAALVFWLRHRKNQGKPPLIDPDLFKFKPFAIGISEQSLQQIALGGLMIVLPLYLQIVFEYNALEAGLSLAPLSLTMFGVALLAGKRAGKRRPSRLIQIGFGLMTVGVAILIPIVPRAHSGWWLVIPLVDRRRRVRPHGLAAEQLHARPDHGGAGERGGRRELRRRLVRAFVRPCVCRRDHALRPLAHLHEHGQRQHGARARREGAGLDHARARRRDHEQHRAHHAARGPAEGRAGGDHPHQHGRTALCSADRADHPAPGRAPRLPQLLPHDPPPGAEALGGR